MFVIQFLTGRLFSCSSTPTFRDTSNGEAKRDMYREVGTTLYLISMYQLVSIYNLKLVIMVNALREIILTIYRDVLSLRMYFRLDIDTD